MGIKDIVDSSGLNIDYNKVMNQLNNAISSINRSKGIGSRNPYMPEDKDVITIRNPENLNTNNQIISGEWNIEYMGRDLSLEEDNYRWDVFNEGRKVSGYYIIERELLEGSWLNVRWGRVPTNVKERKELIDKSRLKDKDRIQRDMIGVINSLK